MGVREYAAALQLSPYALRRWRDRLEDGEVEIDWRAHLHPAARPTVSDITNGATSENSLTARTDDTPATRFRRFFTDAQKLTVVQESEAAGATVSAVARRHGIATGILFRWRTEFGVAQKKQAKLASVTLATDASAALALQNLVRPPDGMMAIELPDGRRVFAPAGSDPVAVRAFVDSGGTAS